MFPPLIALALAAHAGCAARGDRDGAQEAPNGGPAESSRREPSPLAPALADAAPPFADAQWACVAKCMRSPAMVSRELLERNCQQDCRQKQKQGGTERENAQ